ncbi:MAG TPA: hypothetical protein VK557_14100, partial [Pyrinomonadaceae bacterium]|nr:hypothetical protein [Pyrinomonadaceae bacterium]
MKTRRPTKFLALIAFAIAVISMFAVNTTGMAAATEGFQHVFYRTVKVDGLSIFYREAGSKDAPTILLLHGLPSSSRMFEPLFARLSDRFHLV